jgi:hypothetical protein
MQIAKKVSNRIRLLRLTKLPILTVVGSKTSTEQPLFEKSEKNVHLSRTAIASLDILRGTL